MRRAIMILLLLLASSLSAQQVRVAAASDLQFVMQEIAPRFQKETGQTVQLTYGSSGNFYAQIQNGAPFDIFLSANVDYPKRLEDAGLAEPKSYLEYATGKIVLWVPRESKLDLSRGLQALTDETIRKVAIANPQHAPYGQAAVAAMKKEGVYDKVSEKLVLGENISQTASFVVAGSADAGIIALSLAMGPPMKEKGRYIEIPSEDYAPIQQACVILKSARDKAASKQFVDFLKTPTTQDILKSYGFAVAAKSNAH